MYIPLSFGLLFISLGTFAISYGGKIIGTMAITMGIIMFGMVAYCLIQDKLKKSK